MADSPRPSPTRAAPANPADPVPPVNNGGQPVNNGGQPAPQDPPAPVNNGGQPANNGQPADNGGQPAAPAADPLGDILNLPLLAAADPDIDKAEAQQAIALFRVANLALAGQGTTRTSGTDRTDLFGILALDYGLQDRSLNQKLTVASESVLVTNIQQPLQKLSQDLNVLQDSAQFLLKEAKRQFNLGMSNGVVANVAFPPLYRRYVEIILDPLLSIQIPDDPTDRMMAADHSRAIELLRELKGIIIQIVRSLSKYGTTATARANDQWSQFTVESLKILIAVSEVRVSSDSDDKNGWAVLAALTGKNRDTEILPYVVLGNYGSQLLQYAMDAYIKLQNYVDPNNKDIPGANRLNSQDKITLLRVFQQGNDPALHWTTKSQEAAQNLRRYPLTNWG